MRGFLFDSLWVLPRCLAMFLILLSPPAPIFTRLSSTRQQAPCSSPHGRLDQVGYFLENPDAYIQSNIIGFYNTLEACRFQPVDNLVYASSSSVYGANKGAPFCRIRFRLKFMSCFFYALFSFSNLSILGRLSFSTAPTVPAPGMGLEILHLLKVLGVLWPVSDSQFRFENCPRLENGTRYLSPCPTPVSA